MPRNVPPELEDKFRSCKEKLLADGKSEDSAYAICYTSIVEGKSMKDAIKEYDMKYGATISASNMKKVQGTHDFMVDLGASCGDKETEEKSISPMKMLKMYEMGGLDYARSEKWDISNATYALNSILSMSDIDYGEKENVARLVKIARGIVEFINIELNDLEQAVVSAKSFAIPKDNNLDLSYIKALGTKIPFEKLAVKYVSKNTIAHPVFIWGDKDVFTDFDIEFFTKNSDFWDDSLKDWQRPLTWDHGQDEKFAKFEPNPVIGKTVKYYDDDIARWAESVIETDKAYRKMLDQWIEEKRLGYSSDSLPQYIIREPQGKSTWLKMWPWFGGGLTAAPCEPRMKILTPEFLKSLGLKLPDVSEYQKRYETLKRQSDFLKLKNER